MIRRRWGQLPIAWQYAATLLMGLCAMCAAFVAVSLLQGLML